LSGVVVDSSVALTWCFGEQATPMTRACRHAVVESYALVPGLWAFEVGNVLAVCERRGVVSEAQIRHFLTLLENLPKRVEHGAPAQAFGEVLTLARTHQLSTYDATYLELSMRHGLALATLDKALLRAAERAGAALFSA
jgi:predicted nucleic acid-binding protein